MSWRDEKKQRVRDRILRESQRLFLRDGLEETAVEEIAAAAEISRASLFNYFRGKPAIVQALSEGMEPRLVQLVQHYVAKELSTEERLRQLFAHSARVAAGSGDLNRQLFLAGSGGASLDAVHSAFESLLVAGQSQADLPQDLDVSLAAESLYFSFVAGILGWLQTEESLEQQFDRRVCYLLRHLLA